MAGNTKSPKIDLSHATRKVKLTCTCEETEDGTGKKCECTPEVEFEEDGTIAGETLNRQSFEVDRIDIVRP